MSFDISPQRSFQERRKLLIQPLQSRPFNTLRPGQSSKKPSKKSTRSLKGFLDLPLDVVYETAVYLHPLDLLHLSRLSKTFREVFTSRSAICIWRNVLQHVEDLPPCPKDLTEVEYASLVYDKFCMACGTYRGHIKPFYGLRLRLCSKCTNLNIIDEDTLIRRLSLNESEYLRLMSMVPFNFITIEDTRKRLFFIPEVNNLPWRDTDLSILLAIPCEDSCIQMAVDGLHIDNYTMFERHHRRMNKEMKKRGWDPKFYPRCKENYGYGEWVRYIDQGDWNLARPRLQEIYNVNRSRTLIRDLDKIIEHLYDEHRRKQPFQVQCTIPCWMDIKFDTPLYNRLASRYCRNPQGSFKNELLVVVKDLITQHKHVLEDIEGHLGILVQVAYSDNKADISDLFSRATTICLYSRWTESPSPFYLAGWYPDIVGHIVDWNPDIPLAVAKSLITFPLAPTAEMVLKVLGQRKSATREQIEVLGQFYCRCGHFECSKPLPFCDLVRHVYEEGNRTLSAEMRTYYDSRTMKTLTLHNGHEHTSTLQGLIGIVGNLTALTELPIIRLDDEGVSIAENVERALQTGWLVNVVSDRQTS